MNLINPRHKLPVEGQIIWALCVEQRDTDEQGKPCTPSAEIVTCKIEMSRYGCPEAHRWGQSYDKKYFFKWDGCPSENHDEELVLAWAPFEGLPAWETIGSDESKRMIMLTEEYKKAKKEDEVEEAIEKARNAASPHFIKTIDKKPIHDGTYVVANKGGVWLSRYEQKTCNPWIAPNGELVAAWYPVPSHY